MDSLTYLLSLIDQATTTYISAAFFNLVAALTGPTFRNLLVLFFILYGFGIWRGLIKAEFEVLIFNMVKVALIYGFVFVFSLYSSVFVDLMTNGPDALAARMLGSEAGTISSAIGRTYDKSLKAASLAFSKSGVILPFVLGTIILFSSTVLIIFVGFLIAIAKIAIAILLGLGPLVIVLLLFKGTARMFDAWLQQLLNFFLYVVLTISVMTLIGDIYERVVTAVPVDADEINVGSVIPILLATLIGALILRQVPAIASAIAGGVQVTTLGAESGPGNALSEILRRNLIGAGRFRNRGPKPGEQINTATNKVIKK